MGGWGQGGMCPPQVLGYQLTLFGPRGADYARHITSCPPIFSDCAAFLAVYKQMDFNLKFKVILSENVSVLYFSRSIKKETDVVHVQCDLKVHKKTF